MKVSTLYPSKFFRTADLTGRTVLRLTIQRVTTARFRDSEEKLEIHFDEDSRALTLNATNSRRLADALGDETDAWRGAKIELYLGRVKFGTETVDSLQVRIPESLSPQPRESAAPPESAKVAPAGAVKLATMEDDIPF